MEVAPREPVAAAVAVGVAHAVGVGAPLAEVVIVANAKPVSLLGGLADAAPVAQALPLCEALYVGKKVGDGPAEGVPAGEREALPSTLPLTLAEGEAVSTAAVEDGVATAALPVEQGVPAAAVKEDAPVLEREALEQALRDESAEGEWLIKREPVAARRLAVAPPLPLSAPVGDAETTGERLLERRALPEREALAHAVAEPRAPLPLALALCVRVAVGGAEGLAPSLGDAVMELLPHIEAVGGVEGSAVGLPEPAPLPLAPPLGECGALPGALALAGGVAVAVALEAPETVRLREGEPDAPTDTDAVASALCEGVGEGAPDAVSAPLHEAVPLRAADCEAHAELTDDEVPLALSQARAVAEPEPLPLSEEGGVSDAAALSLAPAEAVPCEGVAEGVAPTVPVGDGVADPLAVEAREAMPLAVEAREAVPLALGPLLRVPSADAEPVADCAPSEAVAAPDGEGRGEPVGGPEGVPEGQWEARPEIDALGVADAPPVPDAVAHSVGAPTEAVAARLPVASGDPVVVAAAEGEADTRADRDALLRAVAQPLPLCAPDALWGALAELLRLALPDAVCCSAPPLVGVRASLSVAASVGETEAQEEALPAVDGVGGALAQPEALASALGESEPLARALGESEPLAEAHPLRRTRPLTLPLAQGEGEGEGRALALPLAPPAGLPVALRLAKADVVAWRGGDAVTEAPLLKEGLPEPPEALGEAVRRPLALLLPLRDGDGEALGERLQEGLALPRAVPVGRETVPLREGLPEKEALSDDEREPRSEAVPLPLPLNVGGCEGDASADTLALPDPDALAGTETLARLSEALKEPVGVELPQALRVGLPLGVAL